MWFLYLLLSLGDENARTSGSFDLLLGLFAEELGLDDNRDGRKRPVSENLVKSSLGHVNDGSFSAVLSSLCLLSDVLGDESPQFGKVESRSERDITLEMKVSHTDLSEVTRMVLIEQNTMMMLSSRVSSSTWMLSVLSDTSVSRGHVSSLLTVLAVSGDLLFDTCVYVCLCVCERGCGCGGYIYIYIYGRIGNTSVRE